MIYFQEPGVKIIIQNYIESYMQLIIVHKITPLTQMLNLNSLLLGDCCYKSEVNKVKRCK